MDNAYLKLLQEARERRADLLAERNQIEARLAAENAQIALLERLTGSPEGETVSLADVIQAVAKNGGISGGLTDSCRRVLQAAERPLRAGQLVLVLEQSGFPTSRYVDPLSAVTTVLRRLTERGEARVAATEDGWPLFARAEEKQKKIRTATSKSGAQERKRRY
jgi:kynureninase